MKRRWLFAGVLGLVVLVAAALAIFVPPRQLPGHAIAVDPAGAATDALDQLGDLRDIHLTGTLGADNGQQLDVDIVVLAGGAQAVVRDDAGGIADFVVRDGKAAVRANAAWWRNTVPAFVQDYTDKWVKADDGDGFPVYDLAGLTGDQLQKRLADPKATWSATPTLFGDGQPAMALSRGTTGWTVYVSPTSPPRLLGIGGPVLGKPDRLTRGAQQEITYPNGLLTTSKPDGDCRDRAGQQLDETAPTIADLPEPEVPAVDERPELQAQVLAPGGVCYSPLCPFTVTVSNIGNGAGVGTLLVTSSSGGPLTVPLELAPAGQFSTVYNAPNPAPPSENGSVTVPIYVSAFAQVTSLAGPDVGAGSRLHDRGIDPDNPLPSKPGAVGPDVTNFLDQTTANVPVTGLTFQPDADQVVQDAKDMLDGALSSRLFDTLLDLVTSPALRYGNDVTQSPLPDLIKQAVDGSPAEQVQARHTLDLLKRLTAGRPPPATADQAPIHMDNGIVYDDANKQAYRTTVITDQGKNGKGDAGEALVTSIGDAVDDLDQANVPQGFSKVVELYVDGGSAGLGNLSRAQLTKALVDARWQGKGVKDVVLDGSGKPLVQGISVISTGSAQPDKGAVNGTFLYDVNDLTALGQTKSATAPAGPPPSATPHFTPYSRQHTLGGDPYETNAPDDAGGHRYGTGSPGKTEFPQTWTDQDVENNAIELVDRANQNAKNGTSYPPNTADATSVSATKGNKNQMRVEVWGWTYKGTVNGVEMEVTMLQDGTLMAYPTGKYADQNGTLQTSPNDPTRPDLPYVNPGGKGTPTKAPKPTKAEIPKPGGAAGETEEVPIKQTGRTVWVRPTTAGGQGQWRTPAVAKPSSGPRVNVTVTTDKNGKSKGDVTSPAQVPTPVPAVC